jgi:hypothetical protein
MPDSLGSSTVECLGLDPHNEQLTRIAILLSVGGPLRPFVSYYPDWHRTAPDSCLARLVAGVPLHNDEHRLLAVYRSALAFQKMDRRARRDDGGPIT